jgi:predicted deacylase
MTAARSVYDIGETEVQPGRSAQVELPIARLVTGTRVGLPVQVLHGTGDGPTLWLDAAVHGDEIAGVEIIRRVVASVEPRELAGTILTVPIVNVHGFLSGDRYLPDRRDLNRSFPGGAQRCGDRPPHGVGSPHQPAPDPGRPRRCEHP